MPEQKMYEDHELVALLKEDKQLAIEQIYERYWKRLYLSAYSILKDDEQSQDIVQDVLLQLWIRRNNVKIEKLGSYLFIAVRYKVLTYIRSADNRKVFIEAEKFEQYCGTEEPNHRLNINNINNLLEVGILSLPERCRQVFILSRKEFLSNKEIAERMGITVKAVEWQITIALKHLKTKMSDFLFWIFICLLLIS